MREILYIGKSWGVTVRGRWNRTAKEGFWDDLETERGIHEHRVLFGEGQAAPSCSEHHSKRPSLLQS